MSKYQWVETHGQDPRLPGDTLVNVKFPESLYNVVSVRADTVAWSMATAYQRVEAPIDEIDRLKLDKEELRTRAASLEAARAGLNSALNLQRLFVISAEVREARAQRDYASVKLDHALLREQIATAVSRGHLPDDFYQQLKAWTK